MVRLSKLTDYAVVVLIRLDEADTELCAADRPTTSPALAAATGVPEPTVAKVLKVLAAAGLVTSRRGAHGGYRLGRTLRAISIADVIAAVDGPIALTACVEGSVGGCDVLHRCAVKGRWEAVNDAIRDALSAISLADMQDAPTGRQSRTTAPVAMPAE